ASLPSYCLRANAIASSRSPGGGSSTPPNPQTPIRRARSIAACVSTSSRRDRMGARYTAGTICTPSTPRACACAHRRSACRRTDTHARAKGANKSSREGLSAVEGVRPRPEPAPQPRDPVDVLVGDEVAHHPHHHLHERRRPHRERPDRRQQPRHSQQPRQPPSDRERPCIVLLK